MTGRGVRWLAGVQGIYFAITGIWPLIDIESFMAVTGPKTDLWLVRTVGVLIAVVGAGLLLAARRGQISGEMVLIAVGSALGLAGIDIVYATGDVISDIYLLDAVLELLIVAAWAGLWVRLKKQGSDL